MITVTGIQKAFGGTVALDDVGLTIEPGQVHALLGANGSGKSTLVKILTGVYQPDAGTIEIDDQRRARIASPGEADALGIAAVHQESPLVDTLTVLECVALFRGYPTRRGRVLWPQLRRETSELLERYAVEVDPSTLAALLSPAQRALVGLAIALDRVRTGVRLLILDEVTASLPQDQAEEFLQQVDTLREAGTPVLMVTHRLDEVTAHAGQVTVLREGRVVSASAAAEASPERLIEEIVGPTSAAPEGPTPAADATSSSSADGGASALEVRGLTGIRIRGLDLELRPGEIVGVGGRPEGGVEELPQLLSGAAPREAGDIRIAGRTVPRGATPREFLSAGLALLPADRLRSGGVASLSVRENILLPGAQRYWHRPARRRAAVQEVIERFDVRPPSADVLFGSLSGGNQQKVLLGKWLLLDPAVMVLDDPTSGVDPGARETIFAVLREAAAAGLAVLLFSTELEQLVDMCSRILVVRDGAVAAELAGSELNLSNVTRWCQR